jgi:DNA-binding response OmpR family regulator
MSVYYIAIEKSVERFELYRHLWQAHGIDGIKADSMSEGVKKAVEIEKTQADKLFFISIVADDIDFMPQLGILSVAVVAPILIATSKSRYNTEEHHTALSEGADFYGAFTDETETDLSTVFAAVSSVTRRIKRQDPPNGLIAHEDILVVDDYHKAFIRDTEIHLTAAELKILQYMLVNRGNTLSHRQLYSRTNENNFGDFDMTPDAIYNAIKRLRKKIKDVAQIDYVETIKDVGYRLKTRQEVKT